MDKSPGAKMRRLLEMLRKDGLTETSRYVLKRLGVDIRPFYYIKETVPAEVPAHLTAPPEGFEFSTFGREEVMAISELPERRGYVGTQYVIDNFENGDTCLGFKKDGQVAAFTWFSTGRKGSILYTPQLKENEAYLYDMYVLEDFRGNNLAPMLRYRSYEVLRERGCHTFYSITEASNKAAWRFKEKLGARRVFLGVYVNLFRKRELRRVLRRY
jgi:ribosomal protein S18 acetylase RimI-like enzyme